MAKTRPPYPPEFRRQMLELAGRSPEELAQEFEPTAQSIRNWVGRAECDAGRRSDGQTTAECEELNQLRRRQLRGHRATPLAATVDVSELARRKSKNYNYLFLCGSTPS